MPSDAEQLFQMTKRCIRTEQLQLYNGFIFLDYFPLDS